MTFSIIVPVYNAEKYLEAVITETMKQKAGAFEMVIVDDGSTDGSLSVCQRYAAQYPAVVRMIHQENGGQLAARCNGIRAANGEYCLFLDADDFLQDGCVAELEALLEKYHNPDMVIYSFQYEYPDGRIQAAKKLCCGEQLYTDKTELYPLFFTGTLLNAVWTKAVKREVLLRCEPDVERYGTLRCSEDRLHCMQMLTEAEQVVCTDKVWYRYRLVPDSVTRQFTSSAVSRFNDSILYDITSAYLEKWNMNTPEWKSRMEAQWGDLLVYVFDLFYTHGAEKKQMLAYDWYGFLPKPVADSYLTNPYINAVKKEYITWILQKKKRKIDCYIRKRELRRKLKAILKRK